jgi:hypothetical protein
MYFDAPSVSFVSAGAFPSAGVFLAGGRAFASAAGVATGEVATGEIAAGGVATGGVTGAGCTVSSAASLVEDVLFSTEDELPVCAAQSNVSKSMKAQMIRDNFISTLLILPSIGED